MRNGKRDRNQPEIVKALRDKGITVIEMGHVGGGVPDLFCVNPKTGLLRWLEVKMLDGKLTKPQKEWHRLVPVWVVHSVAEALAAMGVEHASH